MKPKQPPIHKISFESLVSWGCLCGGRWYNEHLKDKTDEDLVIEGQETYAAHLREMERQGF